MLKFQVRVFTLRFTQISVFIINNQTIQHVVLFFVYLKQLYIFTEDAISLFWVFKQQRK